jgi:hypothetical protein
MPGLDPGIQGQRIRSKRPWIAGSSPAMTREDELVDVERPALASVERSYPLVDVRAQLAQLLDMGKKPAPNLLLIGVRKASHLGNGFLQRFDHG